MDNDLMTRDERGELFGIAEQLLAAACAHLDENHLGEPT